MVVELKVGNRFVLTDKMLQLLHRQGLCLDPNCTLWPDGDDLGMKAVRLVVDFPASVDDSLIMLGVTLWVDRSLLTEEYLNIIPKTD